jgi:hypothetical protein
MLREMGRVKYVQRRADRFEFTFRYTTTKLASHTRSHGLKDRQSASGVDVTML